MSLLVLSPNHTNPSNALLSACKFLFFIPVCSLCHVRWLNLVSKLKLFVGAFHLVVALRGKMSVTH